MFELPIITVSGMSLPDAWEWSIHALYHEGGRIPTQYDNISDEESIDASVMIVVEDPFSEPRYHRNFPGGFFDLYKYAAEVLCGVDDKARLDIGTYTYHDRMVSHWGNQIEYVVNALSECQYSRRAQIVFWDPAIDTKIGAENIPCLQRMHFRIIKDALCLSVSMRSNDAFKASYMNIFVFTLLQKNIANILSQRLNKHISCGTYVHLVDSYHIYGKYLDSVEAFINNGRSFAENTYKTEEIADIIDESIEKVSKMYNLNNFPFNLTMEDMAASR